MGPKVCPLIFRLATENGSAAPTKNEKAGWIRSCSEHPCHSTCCVLKAIKRHSMLCGKAWATSGRCMTSAIISTITSPRKASNEISRVVPSDVRPGSAPGASATGFATCTLSIRKDSCDKFSALAPFRRWQLGLHCKARRVRTAPLATCEVREFLGSTILCHRCLAQRSRRTPGRRIVDIDIGYEAPFQAIHEAIVHNVIHS